MKERYGKGMQYMSSQKPCLQERLRPQSLLERLSSPMSQCLMTGTENACEVDVKSINQSLRFKEADENGEKEINMMVTVTTANLPTNDPRLTQNYSHGSWQ